LFLEVSMSDRRRDRDDRPGTRGQGGHSKEATYKYKSCLQNTIADVLRSRAQWKETESDTDFDFIWADKVWIQESFDHMHLDDGVRVNHFRNFFELTRKDLMVKNLKRTRKALEREGQTAEAAKYDFFPPTHVLPMDYQIFVEEFKKYPAKTMWIAKPIGSAQGKGIFLFNHLKDVAMWKKDLRYNQGAKEPPPPAVDAYVVSKYVDNPFLVGGKKFDLRLYVLVTSYSPLTVWMHRDGFARFSKWRYTMNTADLANNFVHLTNVAIQKTAPGYDKEAGCKWQLRSLKLYITSNYGREVANELLYSIQMMIIRTLMAVQKVMINDKHCFELYGYDVLIDDQLKPWLLEVNASPSLTADTPSDYEMKEMMLSDLLDVIDIEGRRTGNEEQMGGFDLIYSGGVARADKTGSTNLGCYVNRSKLKRQQAKLKPGGATGKK